MSHNQKNNALIIFKTKKTKNKKFETLAVTINLWALDFILLMPIISECNLPYR